MARPLLLHVTAHTFSREAHPAIYRQVVGLGRSFRQVVLEVDHVAYVDRPPDARERERLAALEVRWHRVDRARLLAPDYADFLAAGIRRRYGAPLALVGQLGSCGWRALPLAARFDAPVFTLFYGSDGVVDMANPGLRPRFESLRDAPGAGFGGVSGSIVTDVVAWGMPADRTVVQHSGIDLDHAPAPPQRAARAGPLEVVLAGRLLPFKGHATALAGFAPFAKRFPGSRLHLYGDGPLAPALREQASAAGVADVVVFHGLVSVETLRQALERADVAIQPSIRDAEGHAEGLPNTVLEAMAAGLPVIGTRHAGIPEAVIEGETGILIDEGDAGALSRALAELAEDPARRLALGRGARRLVETTFDAQAEADRFAARLRALREAYDRIPAGMRARAWQACLARLERRRAPGRGARAQARLAALANRVAGRIE